MGGFWQEPGGDYLERATVDLGLESDEDLEREFEEADRRKYVEGNAPSGEFPTLDKLYARAWEIRHEEEGE